MENREELSHGSDKFLEVKELWKIFGPKAEDLLQSDLKFSSKQEILDQTGCVVGLRNVSFNVRRGEFFMLMGLSGSGKSTCIRCLLRLIEPTAGHVLVNGEDICAFDKATLMSLRRKTFGMVFQHFGLFPHYTVRDNVAYGLKVGGASRVESYEKAQKAIETVGLKGWEDYLPGSLSGGMQQRVGIARALAKDPEILLMDEPFSGLDPLIRREMQDELVELQDKLHKTIIFVTHDLHEALKLGDRIAIMRDGEIIQLGTPEDVVTSPADDYVREFVQDASPAKILTADRIKEEPSLLIYEWQGPHVVRHLLRAARRQNAFVVSKHHTLLGLVTREGIDDLIKQGAASIKEAILADVPKCEPHTIVEDLFPLATSSHFSIAVTDSAGRFLGVIHDRTILDSMISDREETNND
ncbi:quaternary amine ABC transporter ATP-binding protein [Desulfoferrobacter suflitae]|uniref:quaternary amine ABC transporter ATP-binding protein n=1 Tax=Desulfoferrobacter suflitae TaxID=2865782 RepID=UPI002164581D|nr:glycine betaine/L-proline ABC transporter ATP-binding protein [Desulfoferrobacter suflitae]MCK8602839.1 glycine betaine/L-proline ABC transporter ATP-binding protein [Desulfoferrobacter suflitae]